MKHFRILENKKTKKYTIQYQKETLFGLCVWKNLNEDMYIKYDDALSQVKLIITESDYDDGDIVYHYVDAFKIFKNKQKIKKTI